MNDGLFPLSDESRLPGEPGPAPARDEQVAEIRTGLSEAGISSQQDRQAFVEAIILTTVGSLRDLTAIQARRVIDQLKIVRNRPTATSGTLWDNREKDTWIDRL